MKNIQINKRELIRIAEDQLYCFERSLRTTSIVLTLYSIGALLGLVGMLTLPFELAGMTTSASTFLIFSWFSWSMFKKYRSCFAEIKLFKHEIDRFMFQEGGYDDEESNELFETFLYGRIDAFKETHGIK